MSYLGAIRHLCKGVDVVSGQTTTRRGRRACTNGTRPIGVSLRASLSNELRSREGGKLPERRESRQLRASRPEAYRVGPLNRFQPRLGELRAFVLVQVRHRLFAGDHELQD